MFMPKLCPKLKNGASKSDIKTIKRMNHYISVDKLKKAIIPPSSEKITKK